MISPRFFVVISIFMAMGFSGCNYNHTKGSAATNTNLNLESFENLGFSEIHSAIIGPKCMGCHSPETGSKGGSNLVSYADVKAQLNRVAYRALETKDMPPGQALSDQEQKALASWMDQGAPEMSLPGAGPRKKVEAGPVSFASVQESIFAPKCLGCHGDNKPKADLNLNDRSLVKSKASLIFDRTIIKQDMPLSPLPDLTPSEKRLLLKWFELGMPE